MLGWIEVGVCESIVSVGGLGLDERKRWMKRVDEWKGI